MHRQLLVHPVFVISRLWPGGGTGTAAATGADATDTVTATVAMNPVIATAVRPTETPCRNRPVIAVTFMGFSVLRPVADL